MVLIPSYDGSRRVITVGVDDGGVQAFVPIEGETSASVSSERESIDVSEKFSNHSQSIPGQMTGSLSVEAHDIEGDATGQIRLREAYNAGEMVDVQEASWDGNDPDTLTPLRSNRGYITSIERELARNEAGTFSLEIELQQRWAEVPAPAPTP